MSRHATSTVRALVAHRSDDEEARRAHRAAKALESLPYHFDHGTGSYVDVAQRFGAESLNGSGALDGGLLVLSLRELLENPAILEPPAPVVPRIAWAGRSTLLAAREKDGKTTLAAAGAAAVSSGSTFLDKKLPPGRVLWVGLEEHPAEIVQRFVAFGADPDRLSIVQALPNDLADLEAAIVGRRPDLVVVDTLPALAERVIEDASASAGWTPLMRQLTEMAHVSDAALLLLHHARKSDGRYRDSTAIGANVDMILEMQSNADDPTLRRFAPKGRWTVHEFSVRYLGGRFELGNGGLALDTRILFYVQEHSGCSLRQVRDNVSGKSDDIIRALRQLCGEGAIVDEGDARRSCFRPRSLGGPLAPGHASGNAPHA